MNKINWKYVAQAYGIVLGSVGVLIFLVLFPKAFFVILGTLTVFGLLPFVIYDELKTTESDIRDRLEKRGR